MVSVVVDNTVQMRIIWFSGTGNAAVNVLHGIKKDPLQQIDQNFANDTRTKIITAWTAAAMRAQISTNYGIKDVGFRDLNEPNLPEFTGTGSVVLGTATGDLLPLQTALCCTLRTDRAGASYRGRYYQSGYVEGFGAGGATTSAVQNALVAWITAVQGQMDAAGLTLAVASRKLGKARAVGGIIVRDAQWDTQRRRAVAGI